jgi:NADH-quinone oxidoreductase subunit M
LPPEARQSRGETRRQHVMVHLPLLSVLIFLPAVAALALMLLPAAAERLARPIILWIAFVPGQAGFQFQDRTAWLPINGCSYRVGLDGVSLAMVLLTSVLAPLALLAAGAAPERGRRYAIVLLTFETTLLGIFASLDFLLFYVFYEAVLIPSSLAIGIWGGQGRARAAIKFFLFTFLGSLLMLLALIAMWVSAGTTDMPTLMTTTFSPAMQAWLFWAFVAAFGVKLPIWPLHGWLSDAYEAAPGSTLILFAGVLGKAGGYGFYRFAIQMLPDASAHFAPLMIASGLIAITYAAFVAFAQTDFKRMLAFLSFSHMGVVLVGLFTLTAEGIDGAIFQMLAHGIIIAGLFFTLAILADRTGSTTIADYTGLARRMPILAVLAMLFTMANLGLPGTGGFVGELLVVIGAIHLGSITALLSAIAMVLGAAAMLVLYRRLFFERPATAATSRIPDLSIREFAVLAPLAVLVLWMGVFPTSFMGLFDPQVTNFAQEHLPAQHFTALGSWLFAQK